MSALLSNHYGATSIAADGVIPLGSAIHGYGCGIKLSGDTIQLTGTGYYEVDATATVAVTGTGAIAMQMYVDGVPVRDRQIYICYGNSLCRRSLCKSDDPVACKKRLLR